MNIQEFVFQQVDGDDVDKETSPEGTSCALLSNLDPPTSAATPADSAPSHIYENIDLRGGKTDSRQSAANVQRDHGITSRIYIKPLPPTVPEWMENTHINLHTHITCDRKTGSDTNSTPCCDLSASKPRFGFIRNSLSYSQLQYKLHLFLTLNYSFFKICCGHITFFPIL